MNTLTIYSKMNTIIKTVEKDIDLEKTVSAIVKKLQGALSIIPFLRDDLQSAEFVNYLLDLDPPLSMKNKSYLNKLLNKDYENLFSDISQNLIMENEIINHYANYWCRVKKFNQGSIEREIFLLWLICEDDDLFEVVCSIKIDANNISGRIFKKDYLDKIYRYDSTLHYKLSKIVLNLDYTNRFSWMMRVIKNKDKQSHECKTITTFIRSNPDIFSEGNDKIQIFHQLEEASSQSLGILPKVLYQLITYCNEIDLESEMIKFEEYLSKNNQWLIGRVQNDDNSNKRYSRGIFKVLASLVSRNLLEYRDVEMLVFKSLSEKAIYDGQTKIKMKEFNVILFQHFIKLFIEAPKHFSVEVGRYKFDNFLKDGIFINAWGNFKILKNFYHFCKLLEEKRIGKYSFKDLVDQICAEFTPIQRVCSMVLAIGLEENVSLSERKKDIAFINKEYADTEQNKIEISKFFNEISSEKKISEIQQEALLEFCKDFGPSDRKSCEIVFVIDSELRNIDLSTLNHCAEESSASSNSNDSNAGHLGNAHDVKKSSRKNGPSKVTTPVRKRKNSGVPEATTKQRHNDNEGVVCKPSRNSLYKDSSNSPLMSPLGSPNTIFQKRNCNNSQLSRGKLNFSKQRLFADAPECYPSPKEYESEKIQTSKVGVYGEEYVFNLLVEKYQKEYPQLKLQKDNPNINSVVLELWHNRPDEVVRIEIIWHNREAFNNWDKKSRFYDPGTQPYDITVLTTKNVKDSNTVTKEYIEVKSTRASEPTTTTVTGNEFKCMKDNREGYHLYRLFNVTPSMELVISEQYDNAYEKIIDSEIEQVQLSFRG